MNDIAICFRQCVVAIPILVAPLLVNAQTTEIRLIPFETNRLFKHNIPSDLCMGIGVARNFNARFTAGLDVSGNIFSALSQVIELNNPTYVSWRGYGGDYDIRINEVNANYHTEFAFLDNDRSHPYIGAFVGVRKVGVTLKRAVSGYYGDDAGNVLQQRYALNRTMVPIGLRLGVRGPADGVFADFHTSFGYLIGGGGSIADRKYPELQKVNKLEMAKVMVTLGCSFGFGWK